MTSFPSSIRSADERLRRQKRNLEQFVVKFKEEFDLQQYDPWTVDSLADPASFVRVAESRSLPGYLGLYSTKLLKQRAFVCAYPGVLMWEELADKFSMLYHCPTAVRLDILDYYVDDTMAKRMRLAAVCRKKANEWLVRMTLQGDPTAFGPIINSPRGTSAQANCKLETCKVQSKHKYLTVVNDNKVRVSSTIVALHRDCSKMSVNDELLFSYDETEEPASFRRTVTNDGLYWYQHDRLLTDNPHCEFCFSMHSAKVVAGDDLFLCSHVSLSLEALPCPIGRHRLCFANGDRSYERPEWYCSTHRPHHPLVPRPLQRRFNHGNILRTPPRSLPIKQTLPRSLPIKQTLPRSLPIKQTLPRSSPVVPLALPLRSMSTLRRFNPGALLRTPPRFAKTTASSDQIAHRVRPSFPPRATPLTLVQQQLQLWLRPTNAVK